MMIISDKNFNPMQIAESGQCFRWTALNSEKTVYAIPAFSEILLAAHINDKIYLSCSESDFSEKWRSYLDLSRDYSTIVDSIYSFGDAHLIHCYESGSGIRILKQDVWEMVFSFMVSQNNNIKRISKSINLFCERVGKKSKLVCSDNEAFSIINSLIDIDGLEDKFFAFPRPEEIDTDIFDDSSLGFGYRAPYLKEIVLYARENPEWINYIKSLSYNDAIDELLQRKGIGIKVANCIALFGLSKTESFPIDTHVKQLLEKYYPNGLDLGYFSGFAGIIQQYLFYAEL